MWAASKSLLLASRCAPHPPRARSRWLCHSDADVPGQEPQRRRRFARFPGTSRPPGEGPIPGSEQYLESTRRPPPHPKRSKTTIQARKCRSRYCPKGATPGSTTLPDNSAARDNAGVSEIRCTWVQLLASTSLVRQRIRSNNGCGVQAARRKVPISWSASSAGGSPGLP